MYKHASTRHRHHNEYDLSADIENIKKAFADAAYDVRGKASEAITQSVEGVKEKSAQMQDSVAHFAAEKPFKSLGIALLVGVAIGYLLHK